MNEKRPTVSEYFGEDTFSYKTMKVKLPKDVYKKLLKIIHEGDNLDLETANIVAHAMKEWALAKGATHFCHWFQPMTGATAEKHDSFLDPAGEGEYLERFSGKQLVQGEPDASSFPSGGIRSTFEARGYTAWDITSPAFIMRSGKGVTLCIPTAFISYTGEALDKKTPLLRSIRAMESSVKKLLKMLGDENTSRVFTTIGAEQEYFLIDKKFFDAREDLVMTGRTLLGNAPSRGQQLEDHYFGSIKERILTCMVEVEDELYRLGIPATTRHNEVAPSQFEIAPIFEEANLAVDHNHLVMETIKKVAARNNLAALLHEKPFANVNGSGKHLNWSIGTDTGFNLLNPGDTPHDNIQFLLILAAVIRGVYKNSDILRATVASAGNDHRLGANEAPPAIISIFLGEQLQAIVESIKDGKITSTSDKAFIDLGVSSLPKLSKDNTDRNRTSPFAFTGNKFEFRAVGSSQSTSFSATTLNTIFAESVDYITGKLESAGKDFNTAAFGILKEIFAECLPVLFVGDGYSEEWHKEAAKRGLPNTPSTPEALKALAQDKAIKIFEKYKVLSKIELLSRYNIKLERYSKQILIEANSLYNIATGKVIPSAVEYQDVMATSLLSTADALGSDSVLAPQKKLLSELSENISAIIEKSAVLKKAIHGAHGVSPEQAEADYLLNNVKPAMTDLRDLLDSLETKMADDIWPFSKYWEMLFLS
ncbi:MAG: glutamine synthetase III [Spirochaetes bacterium]|nr:glutamine synthetase III [Spirochaetota bacterium]